MADGKERTAGGEDRKTAAGKAGDSKGQQGDTASNPEPSRPGSAQQDLSGKTSQQDGATGSSGQGGAEGARAPSGSKPRATP